MFHLRENSPFHITRRVIGTMLDDRPVIIETIDKDHCYAYVDIGNGIEENLDNIDFNTEYTDFLMKRTTCKATYRGVAHEVHLFGNDIWYLLYQSDEMSCATLVSEEDLLEVLDGY